ncbi:MAG TPA: hypothetical protein VHS05_12530 [Pyrinomonadaceae bacterium]|jgi:hypothetical protein|nr:hypothetical protein [Pyrinomonadaceae bacterium]
MQQSTKATDALDQVDAEPYLRPVVPAYGLLLFDLLYSEYLVLKLDIKDPKVIALLDSLYQKRVKYELTWSDIYTFDLALVNERPLENLIRKAFDARSKYRSIAGEKEYAEYLASKPPNLTAILVDSNSRNLDSENAGTASTPPRELLSAGLHTADEPQQQHIPADIVARLLAADIRYLLSKFYLYYSLVPMRENLREELTSKTLRMTIWLMLLIIILISISFGGSVLVLRNAGVQISGAFTFTIGTVALAGIMGGSLSMLQRIQNAPVGDPLFNLATLTNSWRGLSLSPLFGAVFASLLFVLFAAGILQGAAFPRIETVSSNVANPVQSASGEAGKTEASSPTETQRTAQWSVTDFLRYTGPKDGVSFALLLIWSFMAGFAERLVPDFLNRFVAKTEAIQGTEP